MKRLQDQNLKVNIQIMDAENNILIQSSMPQNQVNDLQEIHGISGVDQVYNVLLEELRVKLSEEGK
jgi:hypothetical protein